MLLVAEVKARVDDLDALRTALAAAGARHDGAIHQRDTYFGARHGRLKLREQDGAAQLIAYDRPDVRDAKASRVHLAPVADVAALTRALDAALGTRVVVVKRRDVWWWEGAQVRLDDVERLGRFVEFRETVEVEARLPAALAHVRDLLARLGVPVAALVDRSYSDLAD